MEAPGTTVTDTQEVNAMDNIANIRMPRHHKKETDPLKHKQELGWR